MTIEEEIKQSKFVSSYQKLAFNIIHSSRWLENFLKKRFSEHDLTMQQYNILRILRGSQPNPLSTLQIRERMIDKMSDTSRIVDRLILKKLVTKKISKTDSRLVEVRITEKGLELLTQLDDTDDKLASYLSNLTEEEAALVSNLLDKMHSKPGH
ncbi:MarR family transcriptional regulator [Niabella yanshanensis]|uniref:MarR family transcriptional regulator n=1 Tax=Niabella yanshanensis TaxID=577386 RepID=A0ABZ0W4R2_9BACT|nr:MarR family transcriptional regulator [Niabella yanshanensis]WQD37000.1 MarR family transcriptional regulator [Niabella yanshanensis]